LQRRDKIKVIVYRQAEFEFNGEDSTKSVLAFLISKGFRDIDDLHFGDSIICTADYYGKKKSFDMPTTEIPEFYIHRIECKDKNFIEKSSYNANRLNELCRRNGRER
jgi:hypothetical protein